MKNSTAIDDRLTEFLDSKDAVVPFEPVANPALAEEFTDVEAPFLLEDLASFLSASRMLGKTTTPIVLVGGKYKLAATENTLPATVAQSKAEYSVSDKVFPPTYGQAVKLVEWLNTPDGRRIMSDANYAPTLDKLTSDKIVYGMVAPKEGLLGLDNLEAMDIMRNAPDVNWGVSDHSSSHVATRMIQHYLNDEADLSQMIGSLLSKPDNFKGTVSVSLGGDFVQLVKALTNPHFFSKALTFIPSNQHDSLIKLRDMGIDKYGSHSKVTVDGGSIPKAILLMSDKIALSGDVWTLNLQPLTSLHRLESGALDRKELGKEVNLIMDNLANQFSSDKYKSFAEGNVTLVEFNEFTFPTLMSDMRKALQSDFTPFLESFAGKLPEGFKVNNASISYPNSPKEGANVHGVFDAMHEYVKALHTRVDVDHPAYSWVNKAFVASKKPIRNSKMELVSEKAARQLLNDVIFPLGHASVLVDKMQKNMAKIVTDAKWSDKATLSLIDEIVDASTLAKFERGSMPGERKSSGFVYDIASNTESMLKKSQLLNNNDWDAFATRLKALNDLDSQMTDGAVIDTSPAVSILDGQTGTETMMNRNVLNARDLSEHVVLEDFINDKIRKSARMDRQRRTYLLLQSVGGDTMKARKLVAKHINKENLDYASIDQEIVSMLISKIRRENVTNYFSSKNQAKRLLISSTVRPYMDEKGVKTFASLAGTFAASDKYLDILNDLPSGSEVDDRNSLIDVDESTIGGRSARDARLKRMREGVTAAQSRNSSEKGSLARSNDLKRKREALSVAVQDKLVENMKSLQNRMASDIVQISNDLTKLRREKLKLPKSEFSSIKVIDKEMIELNDRLGLIKMNKVFFDKYNKAESRSVSLSRLSPGQYKSFAMAIADMDSTRFDRAKHVSMVNLLSAAIIGVDPEAVSLPNPLIEQFFESHPDMPVITYDGNELWKSGNQDFGQGVLLDSEGAPVAVVLNSSNIEGSQRLLAGQIVSHQIHNGLEGIKETSPEFDLVMDDFRSALLDVEIGGEVDFTLVSKLSGKQLSNKPKNLESKVNLMRLLVDMDVSSISEASNSQIITAMMTNPNMHLVLAVMDVDVMDKITSSIGDTYFDEKAYAGFSRFFDKMSGEVEMFVGTEAYFEDSSQGVDEDEGVEDESVDRFDFAINNAEAAGNLFSRLMYEVWSNIEVQTNPELAKVMEVSDKMTAYSLQQRKTWAELQLDKQDRDGKSAIGDIKTVYLDEFFTSKGIADPASLTANLDARKHFSKLYGFLNPDLNYKLKAEAVSVINSIRDLGNSGHTVRAYAQFFNFFQSKADSDVSWFSEGSDLGSAEFSIAAVALKEAQTAMEVMSDKRRTSSDGKTKLTELEKAEEMLSDNEAKVTAIDAEFERRTERALAASSASEVFWNARNSRSSKPSNPILVNRNLINNANEVAEEPVSGMAVVLGATIANRARALNEGNSALSSLLFSRSIVDENLLRVSSAVDSEKISEAAKEALGVIKSMEFGPEVGAFSSTSGMITKVKDELMSVISESISSGEFTLVDTSALYTSMVNLDVSLSSMSPATVIADTHKKLGGVGSDYSYDQLKRYSAEAILSKAEELYASATGANFAAESYSDFAAPIASNSKKTVADSTFQPDLFQQRVSLESEQLKLAAKLNSFRELQTSYDDLMNVPSIEDLFRNKLLSNSTMEMVRNWINRVDGTQKAIKGNSDFNRKRAVYKSLLSGEFLNGNFSDADLNKASEFFDKVAPDMFSEEDGSGLDELIVGDNDNFAKLKPRVRMSERLSAPPTANKGVNNNIGVGQTENPLTVSQAVVKDDSTITYFNEKGSIIPSMNVEVSKESKAMSEDIFKTLIANNSLVKDAYESATGDTPSSASMTFIRQYQAMINDLAAIASDPDVDGDIKDMASSALLEYAKGNLKFGSVAHHKVSAFMMKNSMAHIVAKSSAKGKAAWKVLESQMHHHDGLIDTKFASNLDAQKYVQHISQTLRSGVDGESGTNGADVMTDAYVKRIKDSFKGLNEEQDFEASMVAQLLSYVDDDSTAPIDQFKKAMSIFETSIEVMEDAASSMDVSGEYKRTVNDQVKVNKAVLAKAKEISSEHAGDTQTSSFYASVEADMMGTLTDTQVGFIQTVRDVFAELRPAVAASMAAKGTPIGRFVNFAPITSYSQDQMRDGDFDSVLTNLPEGSYARARYKGEENTAINLKGSMTFSSSVKTMLYSLNTHSSYSLIGDVFGPIAGIPTDVKKPMINQITANEKGVDKAVADASEFISSLISKKFANDHPKVRHAGGWESLFHSMAEAGSQYGLLSAWQPITQFFAPTLTYMVRNPLSIKKFIGNMFLHGEKRQKLLSAIARLEPSISKRGFEGGDAEAGDRMWKKWGKYGLTKKVATAPAYVFSKGRSAGSFALNKLIGSVDGWTAKSIFATEYEKRTGTTLYDNPDIDYAELALSRARSEESIGQSKQSDKSAFLQGSDSAAINIVSKIAASYNSQVISLVSGSRSGFSMIKRGETLSDKMAGVGKLSELMLQNTFYLFSKPEGLAILYALLTTGDDEDEKVKQQDALDAFSKYLLHPDDEAKSYEDYFALYGANWVAGNVGAVVPWLALNPANDIVRTSSKWATEKVTGSKLTHDGFVNQTIKDSLGILGTVGTTANTFIDVIESYTLGRKKADFDWKDAAYIMMLVAGERETRARLKQGVNEKRDVQRFADDGFGKKGGSRPSFGKKKDYRGGSKLSISNPTRSTETKNTSLDLISPFALKSSFADVSPEKPKYKDYNSRYGDEVSDQSGSELSLVNLKSKEFTTLGDNKLVFHKNNDGDSFYMENDGKQVEVRLYHVDTNEKRYKTYPGRNEKGKQNSNMDRIQEQMDYFGTSKDSALKLGRIAKNFATNLLRDNKFKVSTRYDDAVDAGRKYSYVTVDYQGKEVYLHELLAAKGLVRVDESYWYEDNDGEKSKPNLPDGSSFTEHRAKLLRIAAAAKKAKVGGWGMD